MISIIADLVTAVAGIFSVMISGIKNTTEKNVLSEYRVSKGYNKERQYELERMVYHEYLKVVEMVGHPFNSGDLYEVENVIREISEKEGWQYYSIREESNDPIFQMITKSKPPPWR